MYPSRTAYLRDDWAKLDFLVVVFSLVEVASFPDYGYFKALRCFRLMKLVSHKKVQSLLASLHKSLNSLAHILAITLLVYLIFAILLMSLLEGQLQYCRAEDYLGQTVYQFRRQDCTGELLRGAVWTTRAFNFQGIGESLLSLFVLNSLVNWPRQLLSWVDASPRARPRTTTAWPCTC